MSMDLGGIIGYISPPTIAVLFFVWIIRNPEKFLIWVSTLQRVYAWASKENQKKAISNEIEGKLNLYSKKVNSELGIDEILPYRAKINWIDDRETKINRESFVKGEHVVIKMSYHQSREMNLVLGALDYIFKGLVPRGRMYVNNKVMKSIDLKMTHRILNMSGSYSGIEYFLDDVLPPWLEDPEIESFYQKMQPIEERGFFVSVLLNEIIILGKLIPLGDEIRRKRAIAESKDFVLFLHDLVTRKKEGELCYVRKEIKVGIILIARQEKRLLFGKGPYLRRFERNIEEGCERIYIFAAGRNIPFAKEIVQDLEKSKEKAEKITERDTKFTTQAGGPARGYFSLFQIQP